MLPTITEALLAVGYIPPSDFPAGFDPNAHLKTIAQIIEDKGVPNNLGYGVSQRIPALDQSTLFDNLPKYSIFYSIGHSQGTHSLPGYATFDGFLVWNHDPHDKSGTYMNLPIATTPAYQVLVKPSFIQGVLNQPDALDIHGNPNSYNLVFINGCASTNPTSTDGSTNVSAGYVSAFHAQAYVGWHLPVTLASAATAAQAFFTGLESQERVSDVIKSGIQGYESLTDDQVATQNGTQVSAHPGSNGSMTLEVLGPNQDIIIDTH